jgi:hypothetical protein
VDGYVKQSATGLFAFPVGNKGFYRPFAADMDGVAGAYYQENPGSASAPSGSPFSTTNKGTSVAKVTAKEYWDIDGAKAAKLTLTWDATSAIGDLTTNALSSLTIVGWTKSTDNWDKFASPIYATALLGGASTVTTGSITTTSALIPNTYAVYTLGATEALAPGYYGNMETASCTEIRGWVWDKNNPSAALSVELIEGTTVIATVTASSYRVDIKNAGYGTGNYGFSIPTPEILKNGQARQLKVRVKNGNYTLIGGPKTITCTAALPALYAGNFEAASCTTLKGWVWDKNYPNNVATVELVEGTTVLLTATANVFRQDLVNAGIGTGKYGFTMTLPASLKNNVAHKLSVRVKNGNFTLSNSPRTVTCSPSARLAAEDGDAEMAEPAKLNWEMVAAPNPTTGNITVSYILEASKAASLAVVNMVGKAVWQQSIVGTGEKQQKEIDLSQQASGMYLVQLKTGEKTEVKRIVLAR